MGFRSHRVSSAYPYAGPWSQTQTMVVLLGVTLTFIVLLSCGLFSLPARRHLTPREEGVNGMFFDSELTAQRVERTLKEQVDPTNTWVEVVSWEPRAFLYHNFLTKEECEYLVNRATPHMLKSTVVDNETGKSKDSRVRTSSGMFFSRGQDKLLRTIEERIARYTHIPIEHGEGIQVLHYEVGQKYEPHFDYFHDPYNIKNGGNRQATMLMYLTDVEDGGETVFPSVALDNSTKVRQSSYSECGKTGLAVKPKQGNALLFWSMKPDTTLDPMSLHGSCPVILGNKWSATKWMHVNEYKM